MENRWQNSTGQGVPKVWFVMLSEAKHPPINEESLHSVQGDCLLLGHPRIFIDSAHPARPVRGAHPVPAGFSSLEYFLIIKLHTP